jgi:hypothetical protein
MEREAATHAARMFFSFLDFISLLYCIKIEALLANFGYKIIQKVFLSVLNVKSLKDLNDKFQ